MNAAKYFQQKQQLRKERAETHAQANLERTHNSADEVQDQQKQRRRG